MGNPMFIQRAINAGGIASTANTGVNGSGTLATLVSCDNPSGLRIDHIRFQAAGTVSSGLIRVYMQKGAETARMINEIVVEATSASTTAKAWAYDWIPDVPIVLESGYSIKFSGTVGTSAFHGSVLSGGLL